MAANKRWQNVSDFLNPILQSKCSWGTLIRELPTGQTWSREPTRAQLEEGPACKDWPTGKPLTISWKEPQKGTFSGFRRQLDDYESLDLSPAERPRSRTIWTSLTPPHATVTITDLILASFLTETLSARRSARTTRRGRRTWSRRRAPRPTWTWSPPRWADRTWSSSLQQRTWCQARDPLVTASNTRWDKFSNFTSGVGKFS